MRILLIDIDTLRADHLGCYGYKRNTSQNIDSICHEGMAFEDYYCSDAPCLPSRAALFTGTFGIHSGVIGHGGTAADLRPEGKTRSFMDRGATMNLPAVCAMYGMKTASISTFPERHGAWWFNAGFHECYNLGKRGDERADEVLPVAQDWLQRNKTEDHWFLHVHFWDPHTHYRTPSEIGNPFTGQASSSVEWISEDIFAKHQQASGFHSTHELGGYNNQIPPEFHERQLGELHTLQDVQKNVDGYDCGIYYADWAVGELVKELKEQGIYEETAIIITSDHGEDLGELGRYSEHGCADYPVTRIPLILKWPGIEPQQTLIPGLHYNVDLIPTLMDLLDENDIQVSYADYLRNIYGEDYKKQLVASLKSAYDGKSFAPSIQNQEPSGRNFLVVSCATHAVQRAVRLGDYFYIRTYHDGLCQFPREMLFDVRNDPHETHNLAETMPDKVNECVYCLKSWEDEQMERNLNISQIDPLWTVLAEGGGFHFTMVNQSNYFDRLEHTDRKSKANHLKKRTVPYEV